MNPGVLSIKYNRVVFCAMALAVLGGFSAYQNLGRLEDPEFTIKQALIITPYPGASAEEVAREVTNPIERACQQLGQLDRVESESSRGMSIVTARIRNEFHKEAILDGSTSKMRPVCMVVLTTCLGMIPLLTDPFFGAMAVALMFGLAFAVLLCLVVTPVLYAIFFNIHESPQPPLG